MLFEIKQVEGKEDKSPEKVALINEENILHALQKVWTDEDFEIKIVTPAMPCAVMATQLDLADAQFVGFAHGKWNRSDIVGLVESMGLTKAEWGKWKKDYPNTLDEEDYNEIEEYFNGNTK